MFHAYKTIVLMRFCDYNIFANKTSWEGHRSFTGWLSVVWLRDNCLQLLELASNSYIYFHHYNQDTRPDSNPSPTAEPELCHFYWGCIQGHWEQKGPPAYSV